MQLSPFDKGNLRSSRFLIMLLMLKAGYTYAPYVSLTSLFEEKGDGFFKALHHNQHSLEEGKPDWSNWLDFFLGLLIAQ